MIRKVCEITLFGALNRFRDTDPGDGILEAELGCWVWQRCGGDHRLVGFLAVNIFLLRRGGDCRSIA